jgi:hypothetical protein
MNGIIRVTNSPVKLIDTLRSETAKEALRHSNECGFQPVSGPVQAYEGAINTVGIDLGVSEGGRLAWITTACCPPERILTQQWQGEWPGVGTSQNVSSS